MVDVPAFWMGAALADGGEALAALASARGASVDGDWREALAGATLADVLGVQGHGLRPAQVARWHGASSGLTVQRALFRGSPGYPRRLARLYDAPPVLFVQGDAEVMELPCAVAVVGTRSCGPYGAAMARSLAHGVSSRGGVVVSGLARGIDAEAHRATLGTGPTVAVLGHGLGFMSPQSNARLRASILDEGGAIVASWPDTVAPTRFTFPRRNRWIAGLSDAVCVAQAPLRSGAGITARDAMAMGIDVHVVPGPVHEGFDGCAALMNEGARAIVSVEQTLEEITGRPSRTVEAWFEALLRGAGIDELARMRGFSVSEMLTELGRLEAVNVVVRLPGGRYGPGVESAPHGHVHQAHR
jgi:DNA protecting protein DprA